MSFTIVRSVRGAEFSAVDRPDPPRLLAGIAAPPIAAATMDIPRVEDIFRLDLRDFPKTVPGALE
jgi:hypothetical protein